MILLLCYLISAEATIRVDTTTVMVREDEGVAMVCVSVEEPTVPCPIVFPFEVDFITSDGNASMYKTIIFHPLSLPPFLSSISY